MATRITLRSGETRWTATVDGNDVRIGPDAAAFEITADPDGRLSAWRHDLRTRGLVARDGQRLWVTAGAHIFEFTIDDGRSTRRGGGHDAHALTPPMPATVLRVNVAPGAAIANGDVLIVLEAMKMELAVRAPRDGVVQAVNCRVGEMVQPGTVLIELEEESVKE